MGKEINVLNENQKAEHVERFSLELADNRTKDAGISGQGTSILKSTPNFGRILKSTPTSIPRNKEMAAANDFLKKAEADGASYEAYLPERKRVRKGVITDWEESVSELEEAIMPGQGELTFEKLRKRVVKDGKAEWVDGLAILVTIKGGHLPTELKIGHGHVGVRVYSYVEAVKQCLRCFAFGHVQIQCRNKYKRCIKCLENEHGACDKKAKGMLKVPEGKSHQKGYGSSQPGVCYRQRYRLQAVG
uniref:uncharacterized protein LOC117606338 n=1 Tax=Osmia lignaria TaxID=473952 RepID=UPI001478D991|nr:uncharacterized protein LOC117606338 [Osmia lignaria]